MIFSFALKLLENQRHQTCRYTQTVAASLHDIWRLNRRLDDGKYQPRIKVLRSVCSISSAVVDASFDSHTLIQLICGHQYDIANLNYVNLPARFKYENIQAVMVGVASLQQGTATQQPLCLNFIFQTLQPYFLCCSSLGCLQRCFFSRHKRETD